MAFGNKSDPSKNFSFGARGPVEGADLVREQMSLAHRYYNALTEVERDRRQAIGAADGDLGRNRHGRSGGNGPPLMSPPLSKE
jgi:hypothetical protein